MRKWTVGQYDVMRHAQQLDTRHHPWLLKKPGQLTWMGRFFNLVLTYSKKTKKNSEDLVRNLFLQYCCKASWIAIVKRFI